MCSPEIVSCHLRKRWHEDFSPHRCSRVKHVLFTLIRKEGGDFRRKLSKRSAVISLPSRTGTLIVFFDSLPLTHGRATPLPGFCPDKVAGISVFQFHHGKKKYIKVDQAYLLYTKNKTWSWQCPMW